MLRRLRSLQEQCRSKHSLLERPFCNIGQTLQCDQTPVDNGSDSLQTNLTEIVSSISLPKPNSSLLPSNDVDTVGQDNRDMPSPAEKSAKRSHTEVDGNGTLPSVDQMASPASPARKRSRHDTVDSFVSENIAATAADNAASPSHAGIVASEKLLPVVTSEAEKSFDSTNVELGSSVACETFTTSSASAAFGFSRSGSCAQLNSASRPASAVKSANSSPRTWPSRRDLGQSAVFCIFMILFLNDICICLLMVL